MCIYFYTFMVLHCKCQWLIALPKSKYACLISCGVLIKHRGVQQLNFISSGHSRSEVVSINLKLGIQLNPLITAAV